MAGHAQPDLFAGPHVRGPGHWTVMLEGRPVQYSLTLSPRARKVWLKIDASGRLEVVVPRRMPLRGLDDVIRARAGWILKRIGPDEQAPGRRHAVRFEHGEALPYLGTLYRLEVLAGGDGRPSAKLDGDRIVARVPEPVRESAVREAVVGWFRAAALKHLKDRVGRLGKGRRVGRISVKDQKTRWGSCSTSGSLSFNWRIVMTPPEVVDYLVIHELVHLERHDHSRKFWERVEELCPDFREHEAWLKDPGRVLFAL